MQIPIIRRGGAFGGSSSSGLNLTVVGGTTEPTNPAENTIWVNTDENFNQWTLSTEEPEEYVEGDLWIATQNSSVLAFDIIEDNNIIVYPTNAYQRVGDAWEKIPMAVYKNGEWLTGDLVLYDGINWNSDYPYSTTDATATAKDGKLCITGDKGNMYFTVILDLTNYDTIEIDFDGDKYYSSCTHEVISNGTVVVSQTHHGNSDSSDRRKQFSIPISDLTGLHTFRISMWSSGGYTGYLYSLILTKA